MAESSRVLLATEWASKGIVISVSCGTKKKENKMDPALLALVLLRLAQIEAIMNWARALGLFWWARCS